MPSRLTAALALALASSASCLIDWDKLDPDNAAPAVGGSGGTVVTDCTPGESVVCYSGPEETEDVGVCRAGAASCSDDGQLGTCEGEITPAAVDHCNGADDDCDGAVDDDCSCTPGALYDCYDGPMGSDGTGVCQRGQRMCRPDGKSLTVCTGQVVPSLEECVTAADDDCDGAANEGCPAWALAFGGSTSDDYFWSLRVRDQTLMLVGQAQGSISFGGPSHAAAGGTDGIVALLDADGDHLASARFGGSGNETLNDVAGDANGNVYVVGSMTGNVDFGGDVGAVTVAGDQDGFVLKLDANLSPLWLKQLPSAAGSFVSANGIDVDAAGNVVAVGTFSGTTDLGEGTVTANGQDGFLLRLDASGATTFSDNFGGASTDGGHRVRFDGGGIVLCGFYDEDLDFGGPPAPSDPESNDGFVAKLDAANAQQWIVTVGAFDDQELTQLSVAGGNVVVAGYGRGNVDLGQGPVAALGVDVIVMMLDSAGNRVWSQHYASPGDQYAGGVDFAPGGDVWLTASSGGVADYGGLTIISAGDDDVALIRLAAADGSSLRAHRFGDAHDDDPRALATDAAGNIYLTGDFKDVIDFGNGLSFDEGSYEDIFVARLPP